MDNVFSFRQAAQASADPGLAPDSGHLLAELLAMNEEMIEQLRLERLSVVGTADFLLGMIGQHEKTAALLRAQLKDHGADPRQKSLSRS